MSGHWQLPARVARAGAGLSASIALLAGLPWLLWTQIGNPLPGLPRLTQHDLSGLQVQHLVALVVWALWVLFTAVFAIEAVATIRGIRAPRTALLSPLQGLAGLLVAAILTAPIAAAAGTASAPIPRPATTTAVVITAGSGPHTVPASPAGDHADVLVRVGDRHYTYTVRRGDTLWHVADVWLGNPLRWHDIYTLNKAAYDRHGRMRGGDLILPGWTLVLPADAAPPPGATPTGPPSTPAPGHRPTPPPTPSPSPAVTSSPAVTPTPAGSPASTPTATTSPTSTSTAPPGAGHTPSPAASPGPHRSAGARPGIVLSGTDGLDLGLAGVLLSVGGLVWAHRRRRYTPQPPTPRLRLDDPDLAPLPDGIRAVRQVLRPPGPREPDGDDGFRDIATDLDADDQDLDAACEHHPDRAGPDEDDTVQPPAVTVPAAAQPVTGPLVLPTPAGPISALWPPAGLGLTGPAADDAARGFLVTALADVTGADPATRTQVIIPAGTLATLLGTGAVLLGDSPRLHVTAGLAEALTLLEHATLARTRAVYDSEADDITGLRVHDSFADPIPPLLLIADTTARHERTRVASVLTQGQRLDIHGVLLGTWPDGNTVTVAPGGATTTADSRSRHGHHPADIGRLTVLDAARAADLLRAAIEADTGRAQPTGRAPTPSPAPQPASGRPAVAAPAETGEAINPVGVTPVAPAVRTDVPAADDSGGAPAEPVSTEGPLPAREPAAPEPAAPQATARVEVRVLGGTVTIVGLPPDGKDKPPLRVKSRELLAYLMAHRRGVTEEALYQEVFTDLHTTTGPSMLNTYVYSLRHNLRAAGGPGSYVIRPKDSERCDLETNRFTCDLWRMQDQLRVAHTAAGPAERIAAYRAAVAEYTGPFADGHGYEWVEPVREAIRRQAIDAHVALADLLTPTDPTAALEILAAAIRHDPYNEALYQRAMRLHAADGDTEAVRQLVRDLTGALADVPAEPSDDTIALADQLTGRVNRSRRGGGR